ncbi:MAG: circularly permuted type 2 ATP-grasp protein [Pseudomonadota bacterium]|nr:circularly permuted type 2 ATP-grasp protein [Pseudomonadota bacterium]
MSNTKRAAHLLDAYVPPSDHFDEMSPEPGALRPHWKYVIDALNQVGIAGLAQRREDANRLLRTTSASQIGIEDRGEVHRPWALDPVPLVIESLEWQTIERGLQQRAQLFEIILEDLYGPRRLLRERWLPAELVFAHPGFLRSCIDIGPPGGRSLILYGADLSRSNDGRWWVTADHTQTPIGMGYALENRVTLSRLIPSIFRDAHPHRLRMFFQTLRDTLGRLSGLGWESPRVAVLSGGARSHTFFEQAYLAHYLGYQLVEGSDLVVADGNLWLQSVGGRQPVAVLLRRVPDRECDPLELDRRSTRGTPGLVHLMRQGAVISANPLGTGLLENPALMAFLPRLCRTLLGEDLRLPSVATWWCGQPQERARVLNRLDKLIIRPIHPSLGGRPRVGPLLSRRQLSYLKQRIEAQPHLYVAQEPMQHSTAPVLGERHLIPQPVEIRSFLVADQHSHYVMPGGLGRIAPHADGRDVSLEPGGITKDVWVLATEPERELGLSPVLRRPWPFAHTEAALSRHAADNLYWFGRHAARAEHLVSFLRETLSYFNELGGADKDFVADQLLDIARAPSVEGIIPRVLAAMANTNPGSLRHSLSALSRNTRAVADWLNQDVLVLANTIEQALQQANEPWALPETLGRLKIQLAAARLLAVEEMHEGQGRTLLQMGHRLERALQGVFIVRHAPVSGLPQETELATSLFAAAATNLNQYRQAGSSLVIREGVIRLLLLEMRNPRSVAHHLARLDQDLEAFAAAQVGPSLKPTEAQRLILEARRALETESPDALEQPHALAELSNLLEDRIRACSDALTRDFLRRPQATRQLWRI